MTITRFEQSEGFAGCCCAFKKLTADYAFLGKENDSFLIFRTRSAIAKVIDSIANLIEETVFSISFPNISLDQKLIFIKQCDEIYAELKRIIIIRLKDKNKMNAKLLEFSNHFFSLLKKALFHLWGDEFNKINLNYLGCYLDLISVGLDCPTNYSILREEAINAFFHYISSYPKSEIVQMVNSVFESICKDDRGINQHTKDNDERFYNILNFLEMFRMTLIDQKEDTLSSAITRVIDNALEIIRPHAITTSKQANAAEYLISKRLNVLEKNIDYKINASLFSHLRAYP
jgi:hypothetical protein